VNNANVAVAENKVKTTRNACLLLAFVALPFFAFVAFPFFAFVSLLLIQASTTVVVPI
jgi:hypothetical protein